MAEAITKPVATVRRRFSSKQLSYLALFMGILALSLSSIFVRWADAPGMVTSFYRMTLATLFLGPVFFLHRRRRPALPGGWYKLPLAAGVFTALDHATWSTAVQRTSVANATLLNNLAPVWVALFAALVWKQRLVGRFWLGLALACAGAFGIFGASAQAQSDLSGGDLLALSSSVFFAGYFLITQRGRRGLDTLTWTWGTVAMAAVVLAGVNLIVGNPLVGYSPTTYAVFLAATLISQLIGYFSVGFALGHLPASVVAPSLIAQPVLTALIAIPLAGEPLTPLQIASGASVLAGIYLIVKNQ